MTQKEAKKNVGQEIVESAQRLLARMEELDTPVEAPPQQPDVFNLFGALQTDQSAALLKDVHDWSDMRKEKFEKFEKPLLDQIEDNQIDARDLADSAAPLLQRNINNFDHKLITAKEKIHNISEAVVQNKLDPTECTTKMPTLQLESVLSQDMLGLEATISENQTELAQLKAREEHLVKIVGSLSSEVENLSRDLVEAQLTSLNYQQEKEKVVKANAELSSDLNDAKRQIANLQEELERLQMKSDLSISDPNIVHIPLKFVPRHSESQEKVGEVVEQNAQRLETPISFRCVDSYSIDIAPDGKITSFENDGDDVGYTQFNPIDSNGDIKFATMGNADVRFGGKSNIESFEYNGIDDQETKRSGKSSPETYETVESKQSDLETSLTKPSNLEPSTEYSKNEENDKSEIYINSEITQTNVVVGKESDFVINDINGTPIMINQDGSPIFINSDGSSAFMNSDGTSKFTNTDGTPKLVNEDGTPAIQKEDGSIVYTNKDGTKVIRKADGSLNYIDSNGNQIIQDVSGKMICINKDGTKIIKNVDGTMEICKTDGTNVIRTSEGQVLVKTPEKKKTPNNINNSKNSNIYKPEEIVQNVISNNPINEISQNDVNQPITYKPEGMGQNGISDQFDSHIFKDKEEVLKQTGPDGQPLLSSDDCDDFKKLYEIARHNTPASTNTNSDTILPLGIKQTKDGVKLFLKDKGDAVIVEAKVDPKKTGNDDLVFINPKNIKRANVFHYGQSTFNESLVLGPISRVEENIIMEHEQRIQSIKKLQKTLVGLQAPSQSKDITHTYGAQNETPTQWISLPQRPPPVRVRILQQQKAHQSARVTKPKLPPLLSINEHQTFVPPENLRGIHKIAPRNHRKQFVP